LRLNFYRTRGGNGIALRGEHETKVGVVDPHERRTGFDLLTAIHEPVYDLAGDPKTQIALDPRGDDAGEGAL
jgi:hypothetical protein